MKPRDPNRTQAFPGFQSREEFERFERFTRSRRQFLSSGLRTAMAVAAAQFLPGHIHADSDLGLEIDQKRRVFGVTDGTRRKGAGATGGRTNLTAADIRFNGFHRFPDASSGLQVMGTSGNAIMALTYSPERGTLLVGANDDNDDVRLYELAVPSSPAGPLPNSAPILTCVANWGDYIRDKLQPIVSSASMAVHHIFWDAHSQGIYTWYNLPYQLDNGPTLVWTRLTGTAAQRVADPVTYTAETYGGWRNNISAWTIWGGAIKLPQVWADANTGGYDVAFSGSRAKSGVGHSHGPSLVTSDLHLFNPLTTPFDPGGTGTPNGTAYSITSQKKIWLTGILGAEHIRTNTVSKLCSHPLDDPYSYTCTTFPSEAPLELALQIFGTQSPAKGETDTFMSTLFFDNGVKWGILNFASLADTPPAYSPTIIANGWDADGIIHRGYSNLKAATPPADGSHWYHNDPLEPLYGTYTAWSPNLSCCHGMIDQEFSATGPWAVCREKFIFLYSPDTYAASIASGNLAHLHNTYADETINLRPMMEAVMGTNLPYVDPPGQQGSLNEAFGGYCQIGNKFFVTMRSLENSRNSTGGTTSTKVWRAVLAEFEVI